MKKPDYVYETFIRASAEQVWEAITNPEFTRRYFHAMAVESTWQAGTPVAFLYEDGRKGVEGEVLESAPPNRLAYTWRFLYDPELAAEPPSRVVYDIEQTGDTTRLRVTHDGFPANSRVLPMISEGWAPILCSLKSLLETGEPLPVAGNETEAAA